MRFFDGGRYCVYLEPACDLSKSGELFMECTAGFCARASLPCPDADALRRTPEGKPYFDRPHAPLFSLSHSGGLWGCAFSTDRIGFDVERERARDWRAVAKRFFHPAERDMAMEGGEEVFFRLWTAKESYVKYLGTGIDETFSTFCLAHNGGISGESLGVCFARPPVPEGFFACVCMAQEQPVYLNAYQTASAVRPVGN